MMEDKDRHVVTFVTDDDAPAPVEEVKPVSAPVSAPVNTPEATPAYLPTASGETDPAPEPEAAPAAEVSVKDDSGYTAAHAAPTYDAPAHAAPPAPKAPKAKKPAQKKYVTRGGLIACMLITMLVSSLLGAFAGLYFLGSTYGSPARDDSKLSQLNLSDATGSELTVGEIIEKNENSVVEIVVEGTTEGMWGQLQLMQGAGSGVVIRKDGYIATNYHVIEGANKVQVTMHNGDSYNAKIIGSDRENDIAVIKVDAKDLTPVEIGDSSKVKVGDLAVAIGNPLGQLGGTATSGIVSALDRNLVIEGMTLTLMQTDAAINGGNSGGGLFNGRGELIGIVESKASAVGVEGLAFALPVNQIAEILNDIIENGGSSKASKSTPAVGVVISDVSDQNAEYYGLEKSGVYIAQVTGENAKKAGFKENDRIVSFNGKEISQSSEFISLVRKCKVGDTVTITVSRDGQEIEIKTVLEELEQAG